MYEGRFQPFFYAGIAKFVGLGILIIMTLIFNFVNLYGNISFGGFMAYSATSESIVLLIDIVVFIMLGIGFSEIYRENSDSSIAKQIKISSSVLSIILFIDIVMVILLFTTLSEVMVYIYGSFNILTGFSAIYVPLKIYRYFNQNIKTTNLKIINKSFIFLGFALFFRFTLLGIYIMIPNTTALTFRALSISTSAVAYVAFIVVATGLIIYSKKEINASRVFVRTP